MTGWWPAAVAGLGVVVGVVAGRPAARWLAAGRHRYPEERDLPTRRFGWVVPTAAVAAGAVGWVRAERPAYAVLLAAAVVLLVVLAAIDVDVHRLPDRFTKPALVVVPVALALVAVVEDDWAGWRRALLGGLVLGAVFLVLAVLTGGSGMGLGDVKLAPTLGMLLGYLGWSAVLLGLVLTFLVGGLFATFLLMTGRATRSSAFAFGPMMVIGSVLVWLTPAPEHLLLLAT